jgi:hypothetical protein
MKPLPDKIRVLRDEIFTTGGAVSPMAAPLGQLTLEQLTPLAQADAARVRILNGSFSPGLDVSTGNFLLTQGVQVTEAGSASQAFDRTVIVLYGPKLYTLKYFQTLFGLSSNTQIIIRPDPTSSVDIEVNLGNDWANNNPMP